MGSSRLRIDDYCVLSEKAGEDGPGRATVNWSSTVPQVRVSACGTATTLPVTRYCL